MKKCVQQDYLKWILTAVAWIALVSYLFYNNWAVSILLSPYVGLYIKERKREREVKRKKLLAVQFKDAMMAVSFSLNVGYSVENAFREALKELIPLYCEDSEIVREFKSIVRRVDNNENIETVLCDFAERSGVPDINYFAEIFRYAKRSGGDLMAIIKSTAITIRQKMEVEQEIQTVISGKCMEQRVMSIIPFGMIGYLRLTSPEVIMSLYGNLVGVVVMTVCLILYGASCYMAKRIVDIQV